MNLITLFVIILPIMSNVFMENNFYFITIPNLLMTETPHQFFVQTSTDISLIIETVHIPSKFKYQSQIYIINKGFGFIPYYVPFVGKNLEKKLQINFLGDICKDKLKCKTTKMVTGTFINKTHELNLINKNFIIFAETDKPIYKPGEKVKLRFMPIYPTNLMREPEAVGKQWEIIYKNDKYQTIEIKDENKPQIFDSIIIENSEGLRVAQWVNISLQNAMNLEYQLTNDPKFGIWKAKANFDEQEEIATFSINKYVLPKFVVELKPPTVILVSDKLIKFQICAKYSTGKKMIAQINGKICLKINKNQKCSKIVSTLRKGSCEKVSVRFELLFDYTKKSWQYKNSKTILSVTVSENGTTSSVEKSAEGSGIKFEPYYIKFMSKKYYKLGIPYFGKIQLLRHNNKPQKKSNVTISLNGWDYRSKWGFNQNYTSDKYGVINFVIPYIPLEQKLIIQIQGIDENLNSALSQPNIFETLSYFGSINKTYLQIQLANDSINCPGNLSLLITTNTEVSLMNIYVQIFSRGQITEMKEYGSVPIKCDSRDDFLGHFNCVDDGTLICLPGWTGDNCREPICEGDCINGACIEPNKCVCKTGWEGINCEKCQKSSSCQNGYCVYGNDCVCFPGWRNYDCSKKGPLIYKYNETSTTKPETNKNIIRKKFEKQTIFERIIDVQLLKQMGPDIHIVVYFINMYNEVVADTIEITSGLENCSHVAGGKFEFDKKISIPKSKVILKMDSGMKNTSCAVRISDLALTQFGKSSNVDLSYLIKKLIILNHKMTIDSTSRKFDKELCISQMRVKRRIWPGNNLEYDSRKLFSEAGITAITNARIVNAVCRMSIMARKLPMNSAIIKSTKDTKRELKKQIREFFPESWLFSYFNQTVKQINLTVPDSMTTWKADAYCMTEKGIWIAPSQKLKVILPFFAELYLPYSIKLDEELSVPIKIFNYESECYEIHVQINVNTTEIEVIGLKSFTLCVCVNDEKTVYFNIKPLIIGKLNITVDSVSKYSSFCSSKKQKKKIEMNDSVRRQLFVEPQGVPTESTFSELLCNKNEEIGIVELFSIPSKIVDGSLRSYLRYNGDVMGQTFDNLDKMVKMPYGCGEQNMLAVVPSIYVLQYLKNLKIENPSLMKLAQEYIIQGFNRQMNYKHDDGSFSVFGKTDKSGSTWLTAFVLRSFTDSMDYVKINQTILIEAQNYLKKMQSPNGCFIEKGKLIHTGLAGGVKMNDATDERLLTAYVLLSMKNINNEKNYINITKALSCVKSELSDKDSNYRLALSAYALSFYRDNSTLSNSIMEILLKRAVVYGRYQYWPFDKDSTDNRDINAADIETTGYAFLALQNHMTSSESLKTVYWLSNQRNSLGGYQSTQDTVVALNALAVYAESIGVSQDTKVNLSITLNKNKFYNDSIDSDNRLVTKNINLGSENISYISIKTKGNGCVSVQLISLYNIMKSYSNNEVFKLKVKPSVISKDKCKVRQIKVCFAYLRRDKSSNMILLTINYPSGWQLSSDEMYRLKQQIVTPLKRIDFQINKMELYYDPFSYNDADKDICFNFQLEEKSKVLNLKPVFVKVLDYYRPDIYTEISYEIFDKICNVTNATIDKILEKQKIETCPNCLDNSSESVMKYISMICQSRFAGVIKADKSDLKKRTFYQAKQSIFYEWKLDLQPKNCKCLTLWSSVNDNFIILSNIWKYLEDKLVLTNNSVMFPMNIFAKSYMYDLKSQCSSAENMYLMVNRIMPDITENIKMNNTCPKCVIRSNLYFSVKNITSWYCANYTDWKLEIDSIVLPTINGKLTYNNDTISVNIELENKLCYCYKEIIDIKKQFRIIDMKNQLDKIEEKSDKPIKLILDNKYEIVDEEIFASFSYIKCKN